MPDWVGLDGGATAARYRSMAERELREVSPSYAAICRGVAGDASLLARLDSLPPAKRQPNLLLGVVRFLGGPVSSWPAFRGFALDRWDELARTMLARRTQTNEPGRCAVLLPTLASLPGPLALLEVGASAGLCLYPDRYAYRYVRDNAPGHPVGAAPVSLTCTVTGAVPLPERRPEVVWRGGLDLHPLDISDDEDVRWLEALIWPEQGDRFATLREAVRVVRREQPVISTGDLTRDLLTVADAAPRDATLVVFHSAVLAYVDAAGRDAFAAQVRALAERRPVCWLSNEAPGVLAGTEIDAAGAARFVLARDGVPVALTGPHGQSLDWLS